MSIYRPIHISESIIFNFKPTRLYIKECHGLKYLGKSVQQDIYKYIGSGVFWTRHVKCHGKDTVRTLWVSDWFTCPFKLQEEALRLSLKYDVVDSKEWANLTVENGLDGGYRPNHYLNEYNKHPRSEAHKLAIGLGNKGKQHTEDTKRKRAESLAVSVKGMLCWNNGVICVRSRTWPGEGWVRGRVKRP